MKSILPLLALCSFFAVSCTDPEPPAAPDLPAAADTAPADWDAWARWVDARHPVGDSQGHGPDVGSDEWASALDHQLGISDADGHGPDLKSDEWRSAVESKLAD